MSIGYIHPQYAWLYEEGWTPQYDDFLLQRLCHFKRELEWVDDEIPEDVIESICIDLNTGNFTRFTLRQIRDRISFMKQRYTTFKLVAKKTHWHQEDKCVTADEKTWDSLFKTNSFAKAYYHKAEPEFNRLCILFGYKAVKQERPKTLILISDTKSDEENNVGLLQGAGDEEEVTSPMMKQPCRKLFSDDNEPCDEQSTNERGSFSDQSYPPVNAFPPIHQEREPPAHSNTTSSSVASSSPFKMWRNPFLP